MYSHSPFLILFLLLNLEIEEKGERKSEQCIEMVFPWFFQNGYSCESKSKLQIQGEKWMFWQANWPAISVHAYFHTENQLLTLLEISWIWNNELFIIDTVIARANRMDRIDLGDFSVI